MFAFFPVFSGMVSSVQSTFFGVAYTLQYTLFTNGSFTFTSLQPLSELFHNMFALWDFTRGHSPLFSKWFAKEFAFEDGKQSNARAHQAAAAEHCSSCCRGLKITRPNLRPPQKKKRIQANMH